MWQLEYPWVFVLIPAPWLAYRFLPGYHEARSALRVPFFMSMSRAVGQKPGKTSTDGRWQLPLNALVWGLILVACARPVLVEKPLEREQPVRDLMLAIDISQSMQTQDYAAPDGRLIDRLAAVKTVVRDFIARRKDDRIGLIVFGTGAYAQAPLTLDHDSLLLLLDETRIGMAGPNTALGDAIGLTIKLLDQAHEQEKVLILLTDGNDTGSAITPTTRRRWPATAPSSFTPSVSATRRARARPRSMCRRCKTSRKPRAGVRSSPETVMHCSRSMRRWTSSRRTR